MNPDLNNREVSMFRNTTTNYEFFGILLITTPVFKYFIKVVIACHKPDFNYLPG